MLPEPLRVLRIMAKRENARIPLISEEKFLHALGLDEHADNVRPL